MAFLLSVHVSSLQMLCNKQNLRPAANLLSSVLLILKRWSTSGELYLQSTSFFFGGGGLPVFFSFKTFSSHLTYTFSSVFTVHA